eukprot:m51a1_g5979 putative cathepsin b-like cysteine protease (316) ;mRNA; r:244286-245342
MPKALFACLALALVANAQTLHEIAAIVNGAAASWYADADSVSAKIATERLAFARPLPSIAELADNNSQPSEQTVTPRSELPLSFDALAEPRFANCRDIMKNIRDQKHCGSCWAVGSIQTMSDRLCLATGQKTQLSAADVAFCSGCGGCGGSNSYCAMRYFEQTGLVSEACAPYDSYIPDYWPDAEKSPECKRTCQDGTTAWETNKTKSEGYRTVRGEAAIMSEIYHNGPGSASFTVYKDFKAYNGGVYHHVTGEYSGGHVVKLYGWGEMRVRGEVEKYWLVANSWGEDWGNNGLFMMRRGTNECGIESTMIFPTF